MFNCQTALQFDRRFDNAAETLIKCQIKWFLYPLSRFKALRDLTIRQFVSLWLETRQSVPFHYNDAIMGAMASQITNLGIVYSTVYSGTDQRKYQSFAPLACVRGIHRWPVNSLHNGPVTQKMFSFDDVIIPYYDRHNCCNSICCRRDTSEPRLILTAHSNINFNESCTYNHSSSLIISNSCHVVSKILVSNGFDNG